MFYMSNPKSNDILSSGNVYVFYIFATLCICAPLSSKSQKVSEVLPRNSEHLLNVIASPILAVDLSTVKHALKSFLLPTLMKVIVRA